MTTGEWRASSVLLTLLALLGASCASQVERTPSIESQAPARPSAIDLTVSIITSGLPSNLAAQFYLVEPVEDGGYRRVSKVPAGATEVSVPAGLVLEGSPVLIGKAERYFAGHRFQSPAAGSPLTFAYERQFLIQLSTWARGAPDGGGKLTRDPSWLTANSTFEITATPNAGMKFSHWGLFRGSEQPNTSRVSSKDSTLRVVIKEPLLLLAAFVTE
jgi:hypothetical protein